jgi:hypothetical protein
MCLIVIPYPKTANLTGVPFHQLGARRKHQKARWHFINQENLKNIQKWSSFLEFMA